MQNQSNHKRRLRPMLAMLAGCTLSVLGAGCAIEGEPDAEGLAAPRTVKMDGDDQEHCVRLMAGQHIHVGWVCVKVDHDYDTSAHCGPGSSGAVKVKYQTHDGWKLHEEHMAAGDEYDDLPKNNGGNPQPGQFPYHHDDPNGHTWHAFWVPLCHFGMDDGDEECDPVTAHFAAHAVVKKDHGDWCQEETAWGEGNPFGGHNWAMYWTHMLECEHEPC